MLSYEDRNRDTENLIRAMQFDGPDWTPVDVAIMPATWMKYRQDMEEIVLAHPKIWPGYRKGQRDFDHVEHRNYRKGRITDCWGCVWENAEEGLTGMVVEHPLADWDAFEDYAPPDPMARALFDPRKPWNQVAEEMERQRQRGGLARGGGLPHGFFYMTLYYLRGFENLMIDLATEDPRLEKLMAMVEAYNQAVIDKYVELGAEYMVFAEDLGLQKSLPISPEMWRRWFKPPYMRMMSPCRERDLATFLHTDGHILEIIPDLIECGVTVLNPQIRANGLEGLQEIARGQVALKQDLDRQLFPFASPSELSDHVAEVHQGLVLPEGGLILYAEFEPDVPLENMDAVCTALEVVCGLPEPASG